MNKRLDNKTAIVTGGCRGIGKAIVEKFINEGAKVFALDYQIPDNSNEFEVNDNLKDNISR